MIPLLLSGTRRRHDTVAETIHEDWVSLKMTM